jgi:hypothetical protein
MHLERVCQQRGRPLSEAMPCVVAQYGDQWTIDTDHPAYPHKRNEWRPIPIGDLVEKGLTALGITKERVEKLTRTEGKPGGCGCPGRQKWLNELGNRVQTDARNALLAAKRFYVGD